MILTIEDHDRMVAKLVDPFTGGVWSAHLMVALPVLHPDVPIMRLFALVCSYPGERVLGWTANGALLTVADATAVLAEAAKIAEEEAR